MHRFQKSIRLASLLLFWSLLLTKGNLPAQLPTLDWALNTGSSGGDNGDAVIIDVLGNAYNAGYHQQSADLDPGTGVQTATGAGIYIQKLDPQGNLIWAVNFPATNFSNIYDLALDASSNLLVVGTFTGTVDFDPGNGVSNLIAQGGKDVFLLKLSPAGNLIFVQNAISGTGVDETPRSIGIDPQGNIVLAGWFTADADFDPSNAATMRYSVGGLDAFVAQYDSGGNLIWVNAMGNTNSDAVLDMTIDGAGNITAVGKFGSTVDFDPGNGIANLTAAGNFDGFLLRFDATGMFVFAMPLTTSAGNNCAPNSITTDAGGDLVIAGTFFGGVDLNPGPGVANTPTTGLSDMFILKIDAGGNYLWSWGFGGNYQDGLQDVTTDVNNNIYVASIYEGTVDFDPSPNVTSATAVTYKDIAVVKFDPAGNFGWAALAGGAENDFIRQLRMSPQNDLYVAGAYVWSADFDPSPATYTLTAVGGGDAFLYRLSFCQQVFNFTITDTTCDNYTLNGNTYTATGTYTQTLLTSQGCDSVITLNLTVQPLIVSAQATGNTLAAQPSGATYQWLDCDNAYAPIPNATGQTFTPAISGNYAVAVMQQNCSDTSACVDVTIVGLQTPLGHAYSLSPNPASSTVYLLTDAPLGDVRITNMLGQVLWQRVGVLENALELDVRNWPSGIYFVQAASKTLRLVKE